jgi:hypothetical protein
MRAETCARVNIKFVKQQAAAAAAATAAAACIIDLNCNSTIRNMLAHTRKMLSHLFIPSLTVTPPIVYN